MNAPLGSALRALPLLDRLDHLQAVLRRLAAERELDRLYQAVVVEAAGFFDVAQCILVLYDENCSQFRVHPTGIGLTPEQWQAFHELTSDMVTHFMASWPENGVIHLSAEPFSHLNHPGLKEKLDERDVVLGLMRVEKVCIGHMRLANPHDGLPFTEADLHLIGLYTAQVGVLIHNLRLLAQEQRARNLAETLLQVPHMLQQSDLSASSVTAKIRENLERLLGLMGSVTCCTSATVALREGNQLQIVAGAGEGFGPDVYTRRWPIAADLKIQEMIAGAPFLSISDTHADPRWLSFGKRDEIQSWVGVPIWASGVPRVGAEKLIGVLNVYSTDKNAFGADDIAVVRAFANQMAIVIENQRLYAGTAERAAELAALRETSLAITDQWEPEALLRVIGERATQLLDAEAAWVWQIDEARQQLRLATPDPRMGGGNAITIAIGEGLAGRTLESGEPQLIEDYDSWPGRSAVFAQIKVGCLASAPLRWRGRVTGVLSVFTGGRRPPFTAADMRVLGLFADQMAIVLAQMQAYQDVSAHAVFLSRLLEATRRLRLHLRAEETGDTVAQVVREVLGWHRVVVSLYNDEGSAYRTVAHLGLTGEIGAHLVGRGYVPRDDWYRQPQHRVSQSYFVDSSRAGTSVHGRDDVYVLPLDERAPYEWQEEDLLIVPMFAGEQEIGFISTDDPASRLKPGRSEIEALEIFAGQAAIAFENARLFQQTEHHLEFARQRSIELALVNELAAAINSTLGLDDLLERLLQGLRLLVEFDRASILLREGDDLVLTHAVGLPAGAGPIGARRRWDEFALNRTALEGGKLVSVPDVRNEPRWVDAHGSQIVRSWTGVPLVAGGHSVGLLSLTRGEPVSYTRHEQSLISAIAEHAALVIQKARLLDQLQHHLQGAEQRSQELALLNRISGRLSASLDAQAVMQAAVDELANALRADQCGLVLLNWSQGVGRLVAQYQRHPDSSGEEMLIPIQGNLSLERVLETCQPLAIRDAQHDPLTANVWDVMARRGVKSILLLPLVVANVVIGTIGVDELTEMRDFTPAEMTLAQTITNHAAAALANARLHGDVTRRAQQLQRLQEITGKLNSQLDLDALLWQVAEMVAGLGYDHVHLFMLDHEQDELVARAGNGTLGRQLVERGTRMPVAGPGLCAAAARTLELARSDDVTRDPLYLPDGLLPDVHSEMAVPIRLGEGLLGVLDVQSHAPGGFDATDGFLLETLSDQIAVSLQNARLHSALAGRARQLAQAYDELKVLDRMKDEFVQNISHELRTPLTFIKGYIELLLEEALGDIHADQRQALNIVAQRTDNLVHLVNDIIIMTRAEAVGVDFAPVYLREVAENAIRSAEAVTAQLGIEVVLEAESEPCPVLGDRQRLSQVFDNLLGNAIKFSPDGGRITIGVRREDDVVRVEVRDEGIGIPDDHLERIWDRFYQIDGTTTRRFGGTGLGLAIVKRLVEAHGGEVGVESTVGEGSKFFFKIPVARSALAAAPQSAAEG